LRNAGSFRETGSDCFGSSNCGTNHYGMGTEGQGSACFNWVVNMAFYEERYCHLRQDGPDERPGDCSLACSLSSVTIECSGNCICSSVFGGDSIFEGCNVSEDGPIQLGVDATDELGPGFCSGDSSFSAVEGDYVG